MKTVGIICEYNPLHLGHQKQLNTVRELCGPDAAIVCLMSGNFVQRGAPAIFDKSLRAKAAVLSGADLVLELPVTYALSSAEGFASGGVKTLSSCCDELCFGAEHANKDALLGTAKALLSSDFPPLLQAELEQGVAFPVARQAALKKMGADSCLLSRPNDILAVEYCKAILSQNCRMIPFPIWRKGDYNGTAADTADPSATSIRLLIREGSDWRSFVPDVAHSLFQTAPVHGIEFGERAMLARLRTMSDEEFCRLPFGSEGLWRKLMHASRRESTLEGILAATKSKRYTRSRLCRMVMCAFLGLTEEDLASPAPYVRVLALNEKGRKVLKTARQSCILVNAGEKIDDSYQVLEDRCGSLYGLFADSFPDIPDAESRRRVQFVADPQ